ncbi:MAG: adenosylhomocysteinase [Candidatus Nitrosocaldaceae archaeon]
MSKIKDPTLKEKGRLSYEWASSNMSILTTTVKKLEDEKPLKGIRLALCLHVTKESSVLAMSAAKLGAEVSMAAANPLSTQDDIAAFLDSEGIDIYAWRGESNDEYNECIRNILRNKPHIITDDGSDTHTMLHNDEEFKHLKPKGGTEETTTGITRLKALESEGILRYPVIAVNNAYTKHMFDNRYGTGQSTIDGLLRAASLLIAGKVCVVCGYGWVGKGIAARARGLGANVIVTEVDPIKALEAYMDGFRVMSMSDASKKGDIFITATGQTNVIRKEHIDNMKDKAILLNAGHFDVEIDVKYLEEHKKREVRTNLDEYIVDGKRVYLIGRGRIANLVAAEGHPPEVMALSFSNQLLSMVYLAKHDLEKRVYDVPEEIDREIAVNALEAMGIMIDKPTKEQIKYAKSWRI